MRVLVVADDTEVRAARARDLEHAGHEVCGTSDAAGVTARVRATRPEALLIAPPGATSALRLLLVRARGAAEAPLPALLLLDGDSLWLHTGLPEDLVPAAAISTLEADGARIAAAFAALTDGTLRAAWTRLGGVTFEPTLRRLLGASGEVSLTPSEAAVLALLVGAPGAFVPAEAVARALWGTPLVDRHVRGAIRSHLHTLRGKLRAAGLDGTVESKPGVGYRLSLEGKR